MIRFTIPGKPVPWKRPGKGRGGRSYDPNLAAKAVIVHQARNAAKGVTFPAGPVRLDVAAYYPRPVRRPEWCPAEVWATGQAFLAVPSADRSNVLKLIEDALGTDQTAGWKLWSDDNQSAVGDTSQWYHAQGDGPRTEVSVRAVDLFAAVGISEAAK